MAEVIGAGGTEPASAADEAAEGEGAGDEEPEDPGVKEYVDREAGPDGEVSEKPIVLDHPAMRRIEHTHIRDRESGLIKPSRGDWVVEVALQLYFPQFPLERAQRPPRPIPYDPRRHRKRAALSGRDIGVEESESLPLEAESRDFARRLPHKVVIVGSQLPVGFPQPVVTFQSRFQSQTLPQIPQIPQVPQVRREENKSSAVPHPDGPHRTRPRHRHIHHRPGQ